MTLVRCTHCKGKGKVELNGVYADTLALLRKHDTVTGAELARVDGCSPNAMNNRLAALERMGLARSTRYGHKRLYQAR